jgi:lysophospholipase
MNSLGIVVKNLAFLVFLLGCSSPEFENLKIRHSEYNLTTSEELSKDIVPAKIDSFYHSGAEGYISGEGNIEIFYKYFLQDDINNEKGAILISDGRTEAVVKYKEVIYDLFNNGYSVYIHDHRGQGFSGRMIDEHDMGFVDKFQYYVNDMKMFYLTTLEPNNHEKKYLLTHSMGGAIGMMYLEQHPIDFDAAAFSSPMLGLSFPTCLVVDVLGGDEPEFAPGGKNYKDGIELFSENTLTNCNVRYERMLNVFEKYPKAQLGGASYKWVNESCEAFKYIYDNCKKIKTPLIVFSGEEEEIVSRSAHLEFIKILDENGKNAKGYLVKKAKHELFIEKDDVRNAVLSKVFDFYSNHGYSTK